jgi:hypothetical protein
MTLTLVGAGCGSKDLPGGWYSSIFYVDVGPRKMEFEGITWEILDKADVGRMIVAPISAHSTPTDAGIKQTEGAAREYLVRSYRKCEITSAKPRSSTDSSFEFRYSCKS